MKVSGIDYGLLPSWEIEVPDSAIVVENTTPERIPPALEDPAKAVLEAIRNPLGGVKPLADHVTSSSKVTIAINDWMGISVHAVPVVLEELRAAGVDERNIQIVVAGGLHPKMSRRDLYLTKVGRDINPPYPSPFHILPPEVIDLGRLPRRGPGRHGRARQRPEHHDPPLLPRSRGSRFDGLRRPQAALHEAQGGGRQLRGADHRQEGLLHRGLDQRPGRVRPGGGRCGRRDPGADLRAGRQREDHRYPRAGRRVHLGRRPLGGLLRPGQQPADVAGADNSRIREYVGDRPPLRQGGVAIFVTPCDGTIDERFRPSDHEMLALFDRLGHDPARLEDYEEEYAHREDLIAKYRFAGGAHPLHPFPVFYENSFILDLTSRIIFAGARSARAAQLVGATAVPTFEDAWQLACKTLGTRDPSVMVTPGVGARMPLLWRVNGGVRGAQERDPGQGAS